MFKEVQRRARGVVLNQKSSCRLSMLHRRDAGQTAESQVGGPFTRQAKRRSIQKVCRVNCSGHCIQDGIQSWMSSRPCRGARFCWTDITFVAMTVFRPSFLANHHSAFFSSCRIWGDSIGSTLILSQKMLCMSPPFSVVDFVP